MPRLDMRALLLAAALAATPAWADIANGDFSELNPPEEGTIEYAAESGPSAWRLVVAASAGGAVTVDTGDAGDGDAWFSFTTLTTGFGANKLEQCVPIDATQPLEIAYQVRGATPTADASGLRVRINPNFYADFASCGAAILADAGGDRLGGGRSNDNVDFDLGPEGGNQWQVVDATVDENLRYEVADFPEGSTWMRLSVRARDESGITDPTPVLQIDDIQVRQRGGNRLINGSFELRELFHDDFIVGADGWFISRGGATEPRAAVGPSELALEGDNLFFFEDLEGGFGSSRLDQCVVLDGATIRPRTFVWTAEPSADLAVRINVGFYESGDCSGSSLGGGIGIEEDFALDVEAGSWTPLVSTAQRTAADYGAATSALLSLRFRDRSGEGNHPGPIERRILVDDAAAVAAVVPPTLSPPPASYESSVEVTITSAGADADLLVTLDGSEPDADAMAIMNGATLVVDQTTLVRVRAREGEALSTVRSGLYVIDGVEVAAPVFSPAPGIFTEPVDVTLTSATEEATVFFTLDGSAPTTSSSSVMNGDSVTISETSTLRALAAVGMTLSAEQTGVYTIESSDEVVEAPSLSPAPGSFEGSVTVSLTSATEGATIFFTLNDSAPTTASESVANGGSVTIDTTSTLRAIAHLDETSSEEASGTYTIILPDPDPEIIAPELSPEPGTFTGSVAVSITSPTTSAEIRYTVDGSEPTLASLELANGGSVTIDETTTLTAIAVIGDNASDPTTGTYTIAVAEDEERDPTQPVASQSFTELDQTFFEDFDDYRGSAGTLPDSLFVSWDEGRTSEPFQGVNTGAFTAYSSDGSDHAFGIREREPVDLRDGRLFFAFTNDTDEPVTEIRVSYDVEAWFIGDRRNRVRLKYDTLLESSERDTFETDIVSTDNPSSETTPGTDVDGSLPEHRTSIDVVINLDDLDDGTGTMFGPLAPGETAYLRWQVSNADDDSGSLRSGLAINNLGVTFPGPVDENGDQPFSFVTLGQMLSEDFNDYRGSAETLPDHLSVIWDESRTTEPFQGVNTGGFTAYTFDDVDHAFGIREREPVDLRDARLLLAFSNDTGSDITHIEVSYDVEAWFIGDRRNRVRLKYDTLLESSERDTFETDIVSTDNPSSTTTPDTEVNGSLAENREAVTVVIDLTTLDDGTGSPFGPLAHGETAFLRWQVSNADGDGGNLRSGLAIDNVVVMPIDPAVEDPDPADPTDPTDPSDPGNGGDDPVLPAAPAFSPAPGDFNEPVTVTLTSSSEGATIFFTLDGTAPTTESDSVANGGTVTIDATATLSAIAVIDDAASDTTTGEFTITLAEQEPTLAAPELSPPGGTFVGSVTVTLTSATEDALIRFTTDGSDPDADSQSVENGGALTFDEDTELRAAAQVDGEISEVTVGNYVIQEGIADDSLANGGFGNLNPRPQTVSYVQRGGPPGWRLVVEARAENDGGTVETGDAFAGEAAFSFNLLSAGFSDNKLEQCVPIDAGRRVDIAYRVRADTPDDDASGLRVRINPNFFASFDDCTTAVAQDSGGNRLSGGRNNDDVDFDLGARGNEWILRGPAEDAGLRYEVADLPEGTTWMRLSVRSRNRSGLSPAPRVRLDDIRVTQGTSAVNLLVNGSFEQIELRDRDFLAGGSGWFVDRGDDEGRRAAAGPMDFALLGSNVFYFEDLSENFGDSRLDQCVALDGEALQPAVFVRTGEPAEGLSLRINADFYASADCAGEADEGPRIRQDFELDIAANAWVNLTTDESRSAEDYGTAQSVLLSLRMRDRSEVATAATASGQGLQRLGTPGLAAAENGNGGGGSLSRRVFIDAVSLVSGAAAPEPEPEPDEPPGADPAPAPAPPGPLRSSGCSASGQPGPFDPTLWVLALLAGLALLRRRRPAG